MKRIALFLLFLLLCHPAYANAHFEDLVYRTGSTIAARVNPILSTLNNIAHTKGKDRNENLALLAYQGFKAYKGVKSMTQIGDASRGISVRVGMQKSKDQWTESNVSQLGAGRNLNLKGGTQLAANEDVSLKAGGDIYIAALKDVESRRSSGVGVTAGYNGGFYGGMDANLSTGKSARYTNASITAGGNLSTKSGRDTNIQGGNLAGNTVDMQVGAGLADIEVDMHADASLAGNEAEDDSEGMRQGGKLTIASLQGTKKERDISGGFTAGSLNRANISAGLRDRRAVDTQSSIVSKGRMSIDVAGNTHLKGAVINSKSGNMALTTESLTYENLQNKDKATHAGVNFYGAAQAGTWKGGVGDIGGNGPATVSMKEAAKSKASLMPSFQQESEKSTTLAAIGRGTIRNHEGKNLETNLSRDPANAHQALKQAEINQYSALPTLAAAFAGEAFSKIGDYAMKQAANGDKGWEDGGAKKVLAHAVIGAITAQISDGKALAGALAAGAREGMSGNTAGSSDLTQQIVSTTIGAAAGAVGGSAGAGAVTAWNGERFNRQLHQREINLIKLNAREFATQQGISVEEATKILSRTAVSMIDETWSQQKQIQETANSTTGEKAKSFLLARSEGTDAFRVDRNSAEFKNARINGVTTLKNMEFSRRNLQAPEGITDKLAYTGGVVVGAGEGAVKTVKGIGSGAAAAYALVTDPKKRAQVIEDFKKLDLGKAWDSMDDHAKEELVTRALNDLYNNEYALGKADGNLVGGLAVGAGLGKAVKVGADALKGVAKAGKVVSQGAKAIGKKSDVTKGLDGVPVETFAGTIKRRVLKSDTDAFRFSGGVSDPKGRFLTTRQTLRQTDSPQDAQRVLQLPEGATADTLNKFTIPRGTEIFVGRVKGGPPGATQVFIKNPGVLK